MFEELTQTRPEPTFQAIRANNWAPLLLNRYVDAYRVARFVRGLGKIVKTIGWVAAIGVAVVGIAMVFLLTPSEAMADSVRRLEWLVLVMVCVGFAWLWCFVLGTLISACSHLLLAVLDQAVNTSPLLNDEQRASIMGL